MYKMMEEVKTLVDGPYYSGAALRFHEIVWR